MTNNFLKGILTVSFMALTFSLPANADWTFEPKVKHRLSFVCKDGDIYMNDGEQTKQVTDFYSSFKTYPEGTVNTEQCVRAAFALKRKAYFCSGRYLYNHNSENQQSNELTGKDGQTIYGFFSTYEECANALEQLPDVTWEQQ